VSGTAKNDFHERDRERYCFMSGIAIAICFMSGTAITICFMSGTANTIATKGGIG
jgi:hypothetical protein